MLSRYSKALLVLYTRSFGWYRIGVHQGRKLCHRFLLVVSNLISYVFTVCWPIRLSRPYCCPIFSTSMNIPESILRSLISRSTCIRSFHSKSIWSYFVELPLQLSYIFTLSLIFPGALPLACSHTIFLTNREYLELRILNHGFRHLLRAIIILFRIL